MDRRRPITQGASCRVFWTQTPLAASHRTAANRLTGLLQGTVLAVPALAAKLASCAAALSGLAPSGLALAVLATGSWAGTAWAATARPQPFHIAAGDATVTLNEFSRQSSLQLLFDYNIVRGRTTQPVSGDYEAAGALRQMLEETGLVFDFVNDRTLAVTALNHAISDSSSALRGDSRHYHSGANQSSRQPEAQSGAIDGSGWRLEEVRVTGTNVRGEAPVGSHVISVSDEDIQKSGAATVAEFLKTLPQAFGGGPTEDTHFVGAEAQTNSGFGSGINLRGLGARSTLVLVNGRWLAPGGTEAEFVDIESIPMSAIERVDILPDGASAQYGADAVGGVVNFVMKDDFSGAQTLARIGSGTRNTQGEYQLSQTLGTRWTSGNAMLSLELHRRNALPSYARAYATSNLVPLGGSNFDSALSNPGNIIVAGRSYAIPAGQDGSHLTAAQLVAGTQNLQDLYVDTDLLPRQERWSLYTSGKQELGGRVNGFADVLLSRREAQVREGGLQASFAVPGSNPFYVNPVGGTDPVTVNYNFLEDLGPQTATSLVDTANVTLGLDIDAGASWEINLYATYARHRENQLAAGQINYAALATALADPDPSTAFNPFGDGSHTNGATLSEIRTSSRFRTDSRLTSANVTGDGPVAALPGGAMKVALGADSREQYYYALWPATALEPQTRVSRSRRITAAFGEITVPVFGPDNGGRGYRRLELSFASRYENYSDFGHTITPKLGLLWSPIIDLQLRGTWGRSVRAPTLADLDESRNLALALTLPDSSSPAGSTNVLVLSGKNEGLTVERARSWTAGLDFTPQRWLSGAFLSLTYFDIAFRNRIQTPTFTMDVLNDPASSEFVTRDPNTALMDSICGHATYYPGTGADCAGYQPGAILDLRVHNMESVRTRGLDFKALYQRSLGVGQLQLGLDGTYLLEFSQQEGAQAPVTQLLNTQNYPIDLKLRATIDWQRRHWGATSGVNFQNHYRDTDSEPHRDISSYTTVDLQLRYDIDASGDWLDNTRVAVNALNLFNVSPPFLNNAIAGLGYDQENADPYGRLLSLQIRKTW